MELLKMPKNNGFTLVEVLVALSVLTIVTIGVIQLVTRADAITAQARQHFVAVNTAREGLELVRALRDNGWFTRQEGSWFDEGLCNMFTYDTSMLREGAIPLGIQNTRLYIQANGEWSHTILQEEGARTPYNRTLEVDCTEKDSDPARVLVTARVFWESRGMVSEVVLKERLYNWLP